MPRGMQAYVDGRIVAVGDVAACLRAADWEHAEAILAVLGPLPARSDPPLIELVFSAHGPRLPAGAPTETHGPLRVWRDEHTLSLSYDGLVTARADAGGILAGGAGTDLVDAWRYVFHFGVPHVLAQHGRYVLHAAGLVDGEGAFLAFGETGAGKSTLVLAARAAGWGALSDDLVVVRRASVGLEACGIGKPFRVPADVAAPPPGATPARLEDARQRWVVEDFAWAQGWFTVRGSVIVEHGRGSRARVEPLAPATLVELALPSFVGLGDAKHLRRWFPLAAEVGRAGGFRLRHSSDPAVRLQEAARALDELARSSVGER